MNIVDQSGLLLIAAEQPRVMSFFIPSLGPAPRWCSFLDNLTEELEEEKPGVFEDYKFVAFFVILQVGDARRASGPESGSFDRERPATSLHAWLLHRQQTVSTCSCSGESGAV